MCRSLLGTAALSDESMSLRFASFILPLLANNRTVEPVGRKHWFSEMLGGRGDASSQSQPRNKVSKRRDAKTNSFMIQKF